PFDGSTDADAKGVRDGWQSNVHNRGIQGRHKGTQCDENEHDPFVGLFLHVARGFRDVEKGGKVQESVCGIESRRVCLVCLIGRLCRRGSFPARHRGATVRGLDLIHGLLLYSSHCRCSFRCYTAWWDGTSKAQIAMVTTITGTTGVSMKAEVRATTSALAT